MEWKFNLVSVWDLFRNYGVQGINNVFRIVNKVENVLKNTYIFDLIDNVEYFVYALYSRIMVEIRFHPYIFEKHINLKF
jgi:hypothetical protein